MKNKLLILILGLLPLWSLAQNPFEDIGIKVKVLTLSNGKYQEFFPNDTLRRVGSVMYNSVTGKIEYFVSEEQLHSEATATPYLVSRWFSRDPLAAKYPSMSPYNFVGNNPIMFVDPDGKDIRVWFYDVDAKKRTFIVLTAQNIAYYAKHGKGYLGEVAASIQYNIDNGGGDNLNYLLHKEGVAAQIRSTDYFQSSFTVGEVIYFNSNMGVATDEGHILSPATILEHEATHRVHRMKEVKAFADRYDTPDEDYGNKEEKKVIEGAEQKTALANGEIKPGEVTRKNHNGASVMIQFEKGKRTSTSTKVGLSKTKKYYNDFSSRYSKEDINRIKKIYKKNKIGVE